LIAEEVSPVAITAAFALVGSISEFARLVREFPRSLGGLARYDQFGLNPLSISYSANSRRNQCPARIIDGAQTDLDGKLRAVLASSKQLKSRPHGAYPQGFFVVFAACDMPGTKTLRHQRFDTLGVSRVRVDVAWSYRRFGIDISPSDDR